MRFNLPILHRLSEALRKRDWFGIGFELLVVVIGVLLGMAASRWAAERENHQYKQQILASLDKTMQDYEYEGGRIHDRIATAIADFEHRNELGQKPRPPIIVFPGMERPPTRAWEAMVATGVAKSLDTDLVFRLAIHFDQADSFGDKYQRFNLFTEREILPFENNPPHFYGPDGKLKPRFAEHVDRLRDLLAFNDQMTASASSIRRRIANEPRNRNEPVQNLPLQT